MQTIALLFLAVYSVSASTLFFNQRHAFDEQVVAPEVGKPCCIPKQVEAILVVVSPGDHDHHHHHDDDDQDIELSEEVKAIVGDADRHNHLFVGGWHYDADNTKVAVVDYLTKVTTKAIVDFQAKKLYLIKGDRCKVRTFSRGFQEACLPSEVEYKGEFSLGITGESLKLDSWQMVLRPGNETEEERGRSVLVWNGSTTKKGCMIVSETVAGVMRGEPVFKQSSVVNATKGIADPSVFTPPTSCNTPSSGNDEDFTSDAVMTFIEKFYAEE